MASTSNVKQGKATATTELAKNKAQHGGHEIISKVIKASSFSYICLQLVSDLANPSELDTLTVRSHITAAVTQFLGLTGSAISLDVLKVDRKQCWIRVPREDRSLVVAALGGWIGEAELEGRIGWQVKAAGDWLSVLTAQSSSRGLWDE